MRGIEADLRHGRLEGCPEQTLKGHDRFKEKLARQIERNPGVPTDEVERKIHDGIRYAFSIDDADYAAGVTHVLESLRQSGNGLEWDKNGWNNPAYKGINSRWVGGTSSRRDDRSAVHTPKSWKVNKTTGEACHVFGNWMVGSWLVVSGK